MVGNNNPKYSPVSQHNRVVQDHLYRDDNISDHPYNQHHYHSLLDMFRMD